MYAYQIRKTPLALQNVQKKAEEYVNPKPDENIKPVKMFSTLILYCMKYFFIPLLLRIIYLARIAAISLIIYARKRVMGT